jgi:hypothetical protein
MATSGEARRFAGMTLPGLALAASIFGSALWGAWATHSIAELAAREVVTVELNTIMGDFIKAEARGGRSPEETRLRVAAYLKAVEASVERLGKQGRTVLVAEAVVAGSVPDLTEQVRADVARRIGAASHAAR